MGYLLSLLSYMQAGLVLVAHHFRLLNRCLAVVLAMFAASIISLVDLFRDYGVIDF